MHQIGNINAHYFWVVFIIPFFFIFRGFSLKKMSVSWAVYLSFIHSFLEKLVNEIYFHLNNNCPIWIKKTAHAETRTRNPRIAHCILKYKYGALTDYATRAGVFLWMKKFVEM